MKTLNWRHTDWSARNFVFFLGQEIVGQLTFQSSWNFNAIYTDSKTRLKFTQKSFWDRKVSITLDDKEIGEMDSGLFSKQTLKLTTGEKFELASNFWGRDVTWKNTNGEAIAKYQQATMSSMGKGKIDIADSLSTEIEKVLISSGLFVRQLILKRVALTVAIVVPILAASRHRN
jgi:hypothetical protein